MKLKILKLLSLVMILVMAFSFLPVPTTQGEYLSLSYSVADGYQRIAFNSVEVFKGQTFTANATGPLDHFDMYLKRTGSPGNGYWMGMWTTSGGLPQTLLYKYQLNATGVVDTSSSWIHAYIPSNNITITNGVTYAMTLTTTTGDFNTDYVSWSSKSSGTYSGGTEIDSTGGAWTASGSDLSFKVYLGGGTLLPIVTTAGDAHNSITNLQDIQGYIDSIGSENATSWQIQIGTTNNTYTTNLTSTGNMGVGPFTQSFNGTAGQTYYYRAGAYNAVDGWYYSAEAHFLYMAAPDIQFDTANFAIGYNVVFEGWVFDLNGSDLFTTYGFQFGLSSGSYTLYAPDSVGSGGVVHTSAGGTGGPWTALYHGTLTDNTTYYARFFVDNNLGRTYSAEGTFLYVGGAIYNPPVVSTDGADVNGGTAQAGTVTFHGTQLSHTGSVVDRGFWWGLSGGYLTNRLQLTSNSFANEPFSVTIPTSGYENQDIAFYAYATGYPYIPGTGVTKVIHIPAAPLAIAKGTVVTAGSTVSGTSVLLKGNITSTGGASILARGFQWSLFSTTNNITGSYTAPSGYQVYAWSENAGTGDVPFPIPTGQYSHTLTMAPTTLFYWQAGIYDANGWKWTTTGDSFTTGASGTIGTSGPPVIITLDPTVGSITTTSFEANERLVTIGAGYVNSMGFDYRFDEAQPWIPLLPVTGNFSLGVYPGTLSGFSAGQTVYYRAKCTSNTTLGSLGSSIKVVMATAVIPGYSGGGVDWSHGFPAFILSLARTQGMDNVFGHWGFMFEIMAGLAFIFGVLVVVLAFQRESMAAKIVAYILAVLEVITLGAFLFTGWLGIWPLVIIVVIFVAIIALYIKSKVGSTGIA